MTFKLQLCLEIPKNRRKIIVDFVKAKSRLLKMHELADREDGVAY